MNKDDILGLAEYIRDAPDFPKQGIIFKDIGPLQRKRLKESTDAMMALFTKEELDAVEVFAGMESRGFPFAAAMADRLGKGFMMVRKPGKLPPPVVKSADYDLEYGSATLEIAQQDTPLKVIVIDDVLATGGTMQATLDMFKKERHNIVAFATFINLEFLNNFEWQEQKCRSVLHYGEQGLLPKTDCKL